MFALTCSQNSLGDHQKVWERLSRNPSMSWRMKSYLKKTFNIPSLKWILFIVKSAMEKLRDLKLAARATCNILEWVIKCCFSSSGLWEKWSQSSNRLQIWVLEENKIWLDMKVHIFPYIRWDITNIPPRCKTALAQKLREQDLQNIHGYTYPSYLFAYQMLCRLAKE